MDKLQSLLLEKLIILGKSPYPSANNVVIMAGGSASGKGTVINNLLGIDGKVIDVDNLKSLVLKSDKIKGIIQNRFGKDVSSFSLQNPRHVLLLHNIIKNELNISSKRDATLFSSILLQKEKPNLIFDVTLKEFSKLYDITEHALMAGYKPENIHIVWVINDVQVSLKLNQLRKRAVPDEVLLGSHEGVSLTMRQIIKSGKQLEKYMDGSIVFVFNKIDVDTKIEKSKHGGSFISKTDYVYVKKQKQPVDPNSLTDQIKDKIEKYIPGIKW